MTQVLFGERIGKQGRIRVGCAAIICDEDQRVLLTRRADNGQWCLPGGALEAGESVAEACVREAWEETGLRVRVKRLVGVYSDPNQLIVYPDDNKIFIVALTFEAEVVGGELGLSDETTEIGFFTLKEMESLSMLGNHKTRIEDALLQRPQAFIK
ncbi:MAG: NUDIX domain-containing protein [Anaerolineales bacterium]|nr:NUDIX domain-containing protein [Anaerolineales bacterium]MCL4260894.1 NUDIX domain-containing protein [Anaerolineales bacterium]